MKFTRVIYADTLLLVNFSMDFLALYISAKLWSGVIRPIRMMLAAVIGAVWALIAVLLDAYVKGLFGQIFMLCANVVCAAIIVAVSFGERTPKLRQTVTFVAVNISLGGAMTAIYTFVGKFVSYSDTNITNDSTSVPMFVVAAVVSGAVSIMYASFKKHYANRKIVDVRVNAFGKILELKALSDSGNLLCEPFSGKPVVIIAAKRMEGNLPSELIDAARDTTNITVLDGDLVGKVRFIPASTVTGGKMMLCFIPDNISVDGCSVDAVVGIDVHNEDYEGCDCIIGQALLNI